MRHDDKTQQGFGEELPQSSTNTPFLQQWSSWEVPLWVTLVILAKATTDEAAARPWSCSHLGTGFASLMRVIYRHQTSHMCKAEHTHKCSQKQSQLTHHKISFSDLEDIQPCLAFWSSEAEEFIAVSDVVYSQKWPWSTLFAGPVKASSC